MTMTKRIRDEFKTFSYTTSLKGLPRVVKSEVTSLRWMWCVATILFLCIAGWQCAILVMNYLEYPSVIDIDETEMAGNFGPNAEGISVLICNNDPLYSDPADGVHLETLEDYYVKLDNLTNCYHTGACAHDFPEFKQNRIWKEIRSRKGYFQYLGADNASILGHYSRTMIRSCEILYYDGLTVRDADCELDNITHPVLQQIPEYFNCYMYACKGFLNLSNREYPIVGMNFILYLDSHRRESQNNMEGIWDELTPSDFWKQGARVTVYPHSEAHDMVRKGRDILPGHFTTLQIGLGFRERLELPYGKCENGLKKYRYKGRNVNYSLLTCMSHCIENGIVENCSCHDGNALGILLDDYREKPYCASMKENVSVMLRKMNCASERRLELYEHCVKKCPLPCFEDQFEITMSTSLWPSSTQVQEFYYKYINGTNIQYRFPSHVSSHSRNADSEEAEYNHSRLLGKIRENFAMLQVIMPDDTYFVITDRKQITPTELVGSLGSILNLWAGITVLFIIEVIEVLVKICYNTKHGEEAEGEEGEQREESKNNNQMTAVPPRRNVYVSEVHS